MDENLGTDPRESPEYWEQLLAAGGRPAVTVVKERLPGDDHLTVRAELAWVEPDGTRHAAATAHGGQAALLPPAPEPGSWAERDLPSFGPLQTAALRILRFEIPTPMRGKGLAPLLITEAVRVMEADHPELLVVVSDVNDTTVNGSHVADDCAWTAAGFRTTGRSRLVHRTIWWADRSHYLQTTRLAGIVPQEWLAV